MLEHLSVFVDARAIEPAVAFESTGSVPALAANVRDQTTGSIPTVELDIDLPALGQERGQLDQDLASDAVFGAKGYALSFGPLAVETAHGLCPQVESQIDGGYVWANAHRADHIAKRVLVARLGFGAFAVVEEPIDGLYVTRVLVLLAEGVVDRAAELNVELVEKRANSSELCIIWVSMG